MAPRTSILVIDDDPQVAAFLERLLVASGFEARRAADEASAGALIKQRRPDLLLVDVMLGTANGWQVAKALAGGAPFILMTGAAVDADTKRDAELLGAAAVVQKPFDAAELVCLIKRLLGA